jgi:alkanesulfonate monooxygenase SsuD/methylene tetrahydromethanopterin reductase-like flavin-dependent oxidoreductase (luciferase family)
MTNALHFGVTLPQIKRSWAEAREAALSFERLGFDSLWVCDHLYGVPSPANAILEAWTELSAVAAITERVALGTLVTPPFFRNPAVLAKQIATLEQIAPGRAYPGFGAGWFQAEFDGYGCKFPSLGERLRALDESLAIMTGMWTQEKTSLAGTHYSVKDVMCEPKPAKKPRVLVGGGGERVLMGIAAKYADTWNNMAVFQGQLAQKVDALRRRCDEMKRDFATIAISQQCNVVIAENESAAKEALAKASKIYGGHMGAALESHGIWGTPERVIECIQRHARLGCTGFVIEFFGRDTKEPAALFAETVIKELRR